jgi:integrase
VSTTTHAGIDVLELEGVDLHGNALRLRMRFHDRRHVATGLTAAAALALHGRWCALRAAGETPDHDRIVTLTIGAGASALLDRKRTQPSRQTKRMLTTRGVEHWARQLRPWQDGPLSALPIEMLRRAAVEDWYYARAAAAPVIAGAELEGLKAVLRLARDRGVVIDERILTLEQVAHQHRELEPFTAAELELLASCAVGYGQRMILLAGTTGMRWGEFTGLVESEVDLEARTITLEPERTKEGRRKIIDLTDEEIELLREQLAGPLRAVTPGATGALPGRPAGTPLVFPTRTGRPWRHWQWLRFVWYPARARAADNYRAAHGLELDAATPFDGRTPHDLRSTGIVLMLDRGMSPAEVATRIGHADGGALIAARYDRDMERRRLRTRAALPTAGLRAAAADG